MNEACKKHFTELLVKFRTQDKKSRGKTDTSDEDDNDVPKIASILQGICEEIDDQDKESNKAMKSQEDEKLKQKQGVEVEAAAQHGTSKKQRTKSPIRFSFMKISLR